MSILDFKTIEELFSYIKGPSYMMRSDIYACMRSVKSYSHILLKIMEIESNSKYDLMIINEIIKNDHKEEDHFKILNLYKDRV